MSFVETKSSVSKGIFKEGNMIKVFYLIPKRPDISDERAWVTFILVGAAPRS